MSTYREIIGKKIKKVSSDPSSGTDGQMWYNSTTGTLRGPAVLSAWSSGGNTLDLRFAGSGAGTQTAGLIFGGWGSPNVSPVPAGTTIATTEEYNGVGWTSGGAMNNNRHYMCGMGTQTA